MRSARHIVWLLLLLVNVTPAPAQTDPSGSAARSSRVAVLPFSDYAEAPGEVPRIMSLVRAELQRRGVELADSTALADALREHRIRNTSELTADQIQELSNDVAADYLLVGSLERYVQAEDGAELALAARLIYVPTTKIEWVGTASQHSLNGVHWLDLKRELRAEELAPRAVRDLLHKFRYLRPEDRKRVDWVRLREGRHSRKALCESILALPFSNETNLFAAGGIVTDRVVAALERGGYTVVDPGRAREAMLEEGNITPGSASSDLLKICREQLGVNLVLTGTVSQFVCGSAVAVDQVPAISVEARLTDVSTGQVVWAKTFTGDGADTKFLFGTGTCYSVTSVADRVATKLMKAIPAHRSRQT